MPTLTTIIQHSFGSLSHSNHRKKRYKAIQIRKEVKLSLFADDMILQRILKMIPENYWSSSMNSVKLRDTKLTHSNLLHFYTLTTKGEKEKFKKQSHLPLHQKE